MISRRKRVFIELPLRIVRIHLSGIRYYKLYLIEKQILRVRYLLFFSLEGIALNNTTGNLFSDF